MNIASLGGLIPVHNGMPYSASKAALIMLTRSIAAEYGRYGGVRANAIAPGWAETDMVRRYAEQSSIDPQEFRRAVSRRAPLGRLATTRDVADLALFLCSDRASYITGQTYVIDGGLSVT
ncbi:SDR family oxidoreductase [Thermogymnomonas acidicola]|uniref:SDR family oxidoreductase n=1 Tax=Thermogymnomonas acidicola TaxID=399579 RepID=UPI0014940C70|nr:SDR family oxidoreductase [Thermogymnomonas acidicola]